MPGLPKRQSFESISHRPYWGIKLKVGDKYQLECGHEGKVIWLSSDEQSFAVQGKNRSCINCGKKTAGAWTPTVYTFQ